MSKFCRIKLTPEEISSFIDKKVLNYEDSILLAYLKGMLSGFSYEQSIKQVVIDEAQDLSGFDFEILNKLLESKLKLIIVGDSRQNTFNTSPTQKNKKFTNNILEWFVQKNNEKKGCISNINVV